MVALLSKRLSFTLALLLSSGAALVAPPAMADERLIHLEAQPAPTLDPQQVVRIQLESLRYNDAGNRGIEVAFRFASPSNKRNTGPLPRFIRMIEAGPYSLMLGFRDAEYGPVEVRGDRARQAVTLFGPAAAVRYVFYLSRQGEAPYENCWMTDSVSIEPVPGKPV